MLSHTQQLHSQGAQWQMYARIGCATIRSKTVASCKVAFALLLALLLQLLQALGAQSRGQHNGCSDFWLFLQTA
jgi:hypothetical protein